MEDMGDMGPLVDAMRLPPAIAPFGLHNLVCHFPPGKPIWVQMIKDPDPLPITAEKSPASAISHSHWRKLPVARQGVSASTCKPRTCYRQNVPLLLEVPYQGRIAAGSGPMTIILVSSSRSEISRTLCAGDAIESLGQELIRYRVQ